MSNYDECDDEDIDNILNQLKNTNNSMKNIEKEYPELKPEDVDAFILKHASKVIIDSSDAIADIKDTVSHGGTSNDVIALSELIRSFTSAVEILSKRKIADNKIIAQKEIKEMDINAKKESEDNSNSNGGLKLELTREEIFKLLMAPKEDPKTIEDSKIIDI